VVLHCLHFPMQQGLGSVGSKQLWATLNVPRRHFCLFAGNRQGTYEVHHSGTVPHSLLSPALLKAVGQRQRTWQPDGIIVLFSLASQQQRVVPGGEEPWWHAAAPAASEREVSEIPRRGMADSAALGDLLHTCITY
jgi:hypothetical protein